jgi:hypothetical protein
MVHHPAPKSNPPDSFVDYPAMSRYSAAVCMRGHYRNTMLDAGAPGRIIQAPDDTESFCSKCGAPVITECPSCSARILGAYVGVVSAGQAPESFCFSCGAPYPWADRDALIMQLRNVLEFEPGLDAATRLEVSEQIAVLSGPDGDDKRRVKAGEALRKLVPKGWEATQPILQTLISAELKKQLGFPPA